MPRAISPLERLLNRSQRYMVTASSVAYVMYALLTALIDPPAGGFPAGFQAPKYWAALFAGATALAVVLAEDRLREIYLVTSLGYLVVMAFEVPNAVAWGEMPMHLTLWFTLNILISCVVFGSRWGLALSVSSITVMLLSLLVALSRAPQQALLAPQLADWVTASVVMGVTGMIAYTLMTFIENNLMLHEQDSQKLRAARLDALTDVYGRGAIEEELERGMAYAQQANTPMSVIVADIDHFKQVNDEHGHAAGDDVLRAVAKRLRRNVGGMGGMVGRWGGEEFIVLLPGLAKPEALVLAERLRREISSSPLAGRKLTASFGVASYRGAGDTTDQLFGRADLAMYDAKRSGRNAVR